MVKGNCMARTYQSTPRDNGFRMPGEFEPHKGCWMLWPERRDTWRLGAKPAQEAFARVARGISQFEPVTMGVSRCQFENARQCLPERVRLVEMSADDAWMRDVGPSFVTGGTGELRGVDWQFNAWGGLHSGAYFPWDRDAQVACKVLEIENAGRYRAPIILEGGSIHVDGQGTLITTEECLLNQNRNPGLSKRRIEANLKAYLGVDKIIWLPRGVVDDETDGHVDNLCCFVRPGVVALSWTDDVNDPQFEISRSALDVLLETADARGGKLKVHKIHQPGPLYMTAVEAQGLDASENALPRREGERLAGSYINFYIANGGVIMPFFGDPQDQAALAAVRQLFPERRVIGIHAREILLGGGNIHCITQQQPL